MTTKQKAFKRWRDKNPYRRYLADENCIHVTRASAAGYMDIGFRCGWDECARANRAFMERERQRLDPAVCAFEKQQRAKRKARKGRK